MIEWWEILHVAHWWQYKNDMGVFSEQAIRSIWMFCNIQGNGWKWNWFENQYLKIRQWQWVFLKWLWDFCEEHGIKREFSIVGNPQQNGVIERKNKIVQEMARTMMNESKIAEVFGYNQYIQLFTYWT